MQRERGEHICSQRAALKVNVLPDKNKTEECVMQMKGGTRYRQQAGSNLSGAVTIYMPFFFFFQELPLTVDAAPDVSG